MGGFHELTPAEMGKVLVGLARNVELERYPKQPHGPKRPKPEKQSGAKIKHVATAKILKACHSAQSDTFRRLPCRYLAFAPVASPALDSTPRSLCPVGW